MGKVFDEIDARLRGFIESQHMFFVATAPLAADGHVNCSPKGLDALRVLGPRKVAYVDYVGSGIETVAHVQENGRIVIMLCAFDGTPKIVRLYGRGRVVERGTKDFADLLASFAPLGAIRSIVVVDLDRISDSCGYGVPSYAYQGERSQLPDWARAKGDVEVERYVREKNRISIDGLPGLRAKK
jgi:hypothetical protein